MSRLSCLLGSAQGTTRLISVHTRRRRGTGFTAVPGTYYQVFDSFVGLASWLIMMWSWRVPCTGTVHFLTEEMREKTNKCTYHTCTASSASPPLLAAFSYQRYSSNHFSLYMVAKKSNTSWYLVRFVPIIVGSEHHTPKSMIHFKNVNKPEAASAANKGHGQRATVGSPPPGFVCRRHHPCLLCLYCPAFKN